MKISSLGLLILFCGLVSSTTTHAQLNKFSRLKLLDRHPPHTILAAMKELRERRPSDFGQVFSGLSRTDRASLVPWLSKDGLLKAVSVDDQLLLMLMPGEGNQLLLFESLKSLISLPDSLDNLPEKRVISEYFKHSAYLIDVAMRIYGERGPLGREKMISLLEYLHDVGDVTQMYYDVPRAWRILFSCYESFSDRLIGTPIEYLFTDEFIEKLLAKAIAENASKLTAGFGDMGTMDYRDNFLNDVDVANDVFVDTIFDMAKGSISWMQEGPVEGPKSKE